MTKRLIVLVPHEVDIGELSTHFGNHNVVYKCLKLTDEGFLEGLEHADPKLGSLRRRIQSVLKRIRVIHIEAQQEARTALNDFSSGVTVGSELHSRYESLLEGKYAEQLQSMEIERQVATEEARIHLAKHYG